MTTEDLLKKWNKRPIDHRVYSLLPRISLRECARSAIRDMGQPPEHSILRSLHLVAPMSVCSCHVKCHTARLADRERLNTSGLPFTKDRLSLVYPVLECNSVLERFEALEKAHQGSKTHQAALYEQAVREFRHRSGFVTALSKWHRANALLQRLEAFRRMEEQEELLNRNVDLWVASLRRVSEVTSPI